MSKSIFEFIINPVLSLENQGKIINCISKKCKMFKKLFDDFWSLFYLRIGGLLSVIRRLEFKSRCSEDQR